jgi:hypothetical protein
MVGLGHRDAKAPSLGLPPQIEERAARALDGDDLLDEIVVDVLVQMYDKPASGLLDQAGALSRLAVAL